MNIGLPKKSTRKILVVDDNEVVIKTISMKLQGAGYPVATAMDSTETMAAVRQENPDLIVLDVSLPPAPTGVAWDGFRILESVRQLDSARLTPVIVITGNEDPQTKDQSARFGAVAIFQKPLEYDYLLKVIRATLGEGPG